MWSFSIFGKYLNHVHKFNEEIKFLLEFHIYVKNLHNCYIC